MRGQAAAAAIATAAITTAPSVAAVAVAVGGNDAHVQLRAHATRGGGVRGKARVRPAANSNRDIAAATGGRCVAAIAGTSARARARARAGSHVEWPPRFGARRRGKTEARQRRWALHDAEGGDLSAVRHDVTFERPSASVR